MGCFTGSNCLQFEEDAFLTFGSSYWWMFEALKLESSKPRVVWKQKRLKGTTISFISMLSLQDARIEHFRMSMSIKACDLYEESRKNKLYMWAIFKHVDFGMEVLSTVLRLGVGFPLRIASDLSVIPSINIVKKNQRHFEMYIGVFHVVISCLANASEVYERAFSSPMFLSTVQWNSVLDVLWLAYLYLLVVHLLAVRNENYNIVMRYAGFSFAWIMRMKDGPYEHRHSLFMVLLGFTAVVLRRNLFADKHMLPLRKRNLYSAAALGVFCTLIYLFSLRIPVDPVYLRATFYCCLGAFFYHGWQSVPPTTASTKKWDECDVITSDFI